MQNLKLKFHFWIFLDRITHSKLILKTLRPVCSEELPYYENNTKSWKQEIVYNCLGLAESVQYIDHTEAFVACIYHVPQTKMVHFQPAFINQLPTLSISNLNFRSPS